MAGIDSLIRGAVGSFAKDKAASFMTPSQMELARFAMNPQMYLADKGITAVAELLGYGNQYQELKTGAEDQKAYEKEVMRDSIGDMLPTAVGDFVRATPRTTDEGYEASMEALRQSANTPEATARFEDFMRDLNVGDNYPVGPLEEYDQKRLDDEYDFQTSLSDFQQPSESNTRSLSSQPSDTQVMSGYRFDPTTGQAVPIEANAAPEGYTYDANLGMNVPVTESLAPTGYQFDPNTGTSAPIDFGGTMDYGDMFGGGGGGKLEAMLQAQDEYKRGGQICGCKH